jgi:hypothetical protein
VITDFDTRIWRAASAKLCAAATVTNASIESRRSMRQHHSDFNAFRPAGHVNMKILTGGSAATFKESKLLYINVRAV